MIYFTSDTHFNHHNIIRHCNRPFVSVEDMNDVIIRNINRKVRPQDILYHLGDWAFRWSKLDLLSQRRRINCKTIILIWGNHDKALRKDRKSTDFLFAETHDDLLIIPNGQPIVLHHYAKRVWDGSHKGSWHLYGHSHGNLPDDPASLSFDVGVDCTDFAPLSLDEVAERMSKKTFTPFGDRANE